MYRDLREIGYQAERLHVLGIWPLVSKQQRDWRFQKDRRVKILPVQALYNVAPAVKCRGILSPEAYGDSRAQEESMQMMIRVGLKQNPRTQRYRGTRDILKDWIPSLSSQYYLWSLGWPCFLFIARKLNLPQIRYFLSNPKHYTKFYYWMWDLY